jgi:hypothetical protein
MSRSLTSRTPREETYRFNASDAAFAIPWWAQGGKGMAFVTATGGGSGGAPTTNGGSSAASAIGGAVNAVGGNTDISLGGVNALRLQGGQLTTAGMPFLWSAAASAWRQVSHFATNISATSAFASTPLMPGQANNADVGGSTAFGAGGPSGQPGVGFGSAGGVNAVGAPGFALIEFVEAF